MSSSYHNPACPSLEGRIMMLPRLSEIDANYTTLLPVGTGIFNHPVVILSKQLYNGKVAVFILTSFDGTPIQNRHRDPSRRNSYLPIHPATHPDTRCVLTVAHGKVMKKQSYVNFKKMHEIPFPVLRPCWRDNDLHLDRVSYKTLAVELWKSNVGGLAIELRGHGILDHTGHGTSPTWISNHSTSESYGTFGRTSTDAIQPQYSNTYPTAPIATAARNAARFHNYPVSAHQVRQSRVARPSHITPQQTQFGMGQRTYNEGNNDAGGPSWLQIIIIAYVIMIKVAAGTLIGAARLTAYVIIAGWHYFANNVGAN